jgi:hypothetical protein
MPWFHIIYLSVEAIILSYSLRYLLHRGAIRTEIHLLLQMLCIAIIQTAIAAQEWSELTRIPAVMHPKLAQLAGVMTFGSILIPLSRLSSIVPAKESNEIEV